MTTFYASISQLENIVEKINPKCPQNIYYTQEKIVHKMEDICINKAF